MSKLWNNWSHHSSLTKTRRKLLEGETCTRCNTIIIILVIVFNFITINNGRKNFKAHEVCKKGALKHKPLIFIRLKYEIFTSLKEGRILRNFTSSTRSGIKIVSIFAYASETVAVSAGFTFWPEPVKTSSQTEGVLEVFTPTRSSLANSRAYRGILKTSDSICPLFYQSITNQNI